MSEYSDDSIFQSLSHSINPGWNKDEQSSQSPVQLQIHKQNKYYRCDNPIIFEVICYITIENLNTETLQGEAIFKIHDELFFLAKMK